MIDRKTIEHIAKLARLHVTDKEAQEFAHQLSRALGFFEQISQVDTSGVEPLVTPGEIEAQLRPDQAIREIETEELMACAPDKVGNLFKVPPVV